MISKNTVESSQIQKDYSSLVEPTRELQRMSKKKAFTRKPSTSHFSNLSEKKHRLNNQRKITITPFLTTCDEEPTNQEIPVKINFVKRKQRQTEYFTKQKNESNEGSFKIGKDRVSNPFLSRDNIQQLSCIFSSQNHSHSSSPSKNTETNLKVACNNIVGNIFQGKLYQRQQINVNSMKNNENILKFRTQSTLILPKYLPRNQMKIFRSNNNSRNSSISKNDTSSAFQCSYCKNNKEMMTLMNQKYTKIKEQIEYKDSKIRQINKKYDTLKDQHIKLNQKYQKKLQSIQLKQIQLFRQKEQFMNRTQSLKNDLTKSYQKIKYFQIQNAMLLRYKDEYQLMTRQYDIICCENRKLHSIIAHSRKGQNEEKFRKGKNTVSYGNQSNYKNCKHSNQQQSTSEDDLVSLTFSQKSMETF